MPFLFKIVAILVGIFIWKAIVGSFRKANKAMHDDSNDGVEENDSVPMAQLDLETQWREAAKQLACTYDSGNKPNAQDAAISGRFSGHSVTIKRFGHNYVRYFVAFRKAPGFHICVVRDLESIAERILNGHPIYPSKMFFSSQEPGFYCSADSEDAFDRFLNTPSNRSAVLNLVRSFPAGMFNNEGVSVRIRAKTPDISVISRMIAIANALENPSQTPMPDLQTVQKKGLLSVPEDFRPAEEAAEEVPDPPKRFPPIQIDASARTTRIPLPSDTPSTSGRTTVIRISPEAKRSNQSDTLKADVVRSSSSSAPPAPAPASFPCPSEAGHNRSGGTASLAVEAVCAALFGKPFPGMEERAAFDAMKGKRVHWSGELQMCMPFSMDFVFGSQKGIKATIQICKLAQGSIQVQIKAVAAFPPTLRETLEPLKGQTIVFEGELLKFEPFAREIYLQNASLES